MKDNFSQQAEVYAKYRPAYPAELFDFVLSYVKERQAVWDCATGNGQTAAVLANYFATVSATDISGKQLDNAQKAANIFYTLQPAEKTNFDNNSFDLITVSQALHWLQFDEFYTEARRVAKPGAYIAAWMYTLLKISPEIDEIITVGFYKNRLGSYWDDERKYVDENYTSIPFPFEEIECPVFHIRLAWTLKDLEGYLTSWSAVQQFIAVNKYDPVKDLIEKITPLWKTTKKKIEFPVYMRLGRIDK